MNVYCFNCAIWYDITNVKCPSCSYTMTEYEKKLQRQEWMNKRHLILFRDKFACTNCKNDVIAKSSETGVYLSHEMKSQTMVSFIRGEKNKIIPVVRTKYLLTYKTKDGEFISEDVYSYNHLESSGFNWRVVFYNRIEKGKTNQDKQYNSKITLIRTKINGVVREDYVNNLQVHHKYYQENLEPWDYPDNAYQTLCWNCHLALHENELVPYLDEFGNRKQCVDIAGRKQDMSLTRCQRCLGAGYLPQYHYVEGGICFRCRGARYEEFISEID